MMYATIALRDAHGPFASGVLVQLQRLSAPAASAASIAAMTRSVRVPLAPSSARTAFWMTAVPRSVFP
jgi:hypothetical protein